MRAALSILIFLPIVAILFMAFIPAHKQRWYSLISLSTVLLQMLLYLFLILPDFSVESGDILVAEERLGWLNISLGDQSSLRIDYHVGVDGLSIVLLFLTLLVSALAILASWKVNKEPRSYFMLLMLLITALCGVFSAQDFFLFYIFYELLLLPMFFLIANWGGRRREYAAIKFFIYTLLGSLCMLLVLIGLLLSYQAVESVEQGLITHSLDLASLSSFNSDGSARNLIEGSILDHGEMMENIPVRSLAFLLLFVSFAIKLPAVPLHSWLPDAHVEASTPISMMLAGILLKVGAYGLIRIAYGIFPDQAINFAWWLGLFGVIAIIYGALVAMAQKDFKRLIAYSSVSHMGYVLLGLGSLEAMGYQGAIFQLFTHGLVSTLLFMLVGVLYERVKVREIEAFSGLLSKMPNYSYITLVAFAAGFGLPGLCTFISEFLVFMGAMQSAASLTALSMWMAIGAVLGIILGAAYFLRAYRKMFFGKFEPIGSDRWEERLTDLNPREYFIVLPLVILIVLLGIFPGIFLQFIDGFVIGMDKQIGLFL